MAAPAPLVDGSGAPLPLRVRLERFVERLKVLLTPPRQIRPTRAGYGFMVLTLSVGFAALNTGNNLLYLILGMMLSLIGVSGILSELSVRRMTVVRRFPAELTAGVPVSATLTLHCNKRLPGIGIWADERTPEGIEASPAYFVYIPPGGELTLNATYRFLRRGRQRLEAVEISTTYPFGLFSRSYPFRVTDEVLVLPPVEAVGAHRDPADGIEGEYPVSRKGQGEDFYGLREWSLGDDPRYIHWKSSARRARLLVRENVAQERQRLVVRLELTHPLPEDTAYERALVMVVSFAAHYLERGFQVAVDLPGTAVPFESGQGQLRRILRTAALAPRAEEAAELPASSVVWPQGARISIRVAGQDVSVEEAT